jgi:hypothetical protein
LDEAAMGDVMILVLMYLAVGAGLFAQPFPGTAQPRDFGWKRQGQIFMDTLPTVLGWPIVLWRLVRA